MKDSQIAALIKNCTSETVWRDSTGHKGTGTLTLVVRRRSSVTTATWVGMWQHSGQRRKLTLGRYPDMRLSDARLAFSEKVRAPRLSGQDPVTVPKKHEKPTVEALFQGYVDSLRAAGKPSADNFEFTLLKGGKNCADGIGRHKLAADVTPGDVIKALAQWFDRGCRRQADIARANMSAAFNYGLKSAHTYTTAQRFDWGLTVNPVAMVEKDAGAVQTRDRNLSADELALLWHGLSGGRFMPDTADAIRLVLLCGQRVQETLRAEGAEFDLVNGTWLIPAVKTKGGKHDHVVPLPKLAIPVVERLVKRHGKGPLCKMPYTSLNQALKRWAAGANVPTFQTRDLRRTWKSRAADAGVDRFTRDLIQQHAKGDTGSRHYDRADYLPQMKAAMDSWNAWIETVLQSRNG